MKLALAMASAAGAMAIATPAAAQDAAATALPELTGNLLSAFNEICLDRRGSWKGMKQAAESSAFGFERVRGAGHQQADYMAFPLSVSLKRWGQVGFLCLVESVVEDELSASDLGALLNARGLGLTNVSFAAEAEGMSGALPDSGRSTPAGTMFTTVTIRVSDTQLEGAQIVQLVIYSN